MEFARDLVAQFSRWCSASKVSSFTELCNLVVLEQFKQSVPSCIAAYINERKVKTPSDAAVLADEYILTHKRIFGEQKLKSYGPKAFDRSQLDLDPVYSKQDTENTARKDTNCNYCQKSGHWKNRCPALKKKGFDVSQVKSTALTVPVESTKNSLTPFQMRTKTLAAAEIAAGYAPFISEGFVSLVGSNEKVAVKILRDSGALNTFICDSVLPFSPQSDTGRCVPVRGMGLTTIFVPVHKMFLSCSLVHGEVEVGVRPELPVEGVDVILGNDVAGARIWSDISRTDEQLVVPSVASAVEHPDFGVPAQTVSSACAVTRSMTASLSDTKSDSQKDSVKVALSLPVDLLSVSHAELVEAQKLDPSLKQLFDSVVPTCELEKQSPTYYLQDGLLLRRWVPCGEQLADAVVEQVVLPSKYRQSVLKAAHDGAAGHMGVRKTYDRILRHFFWPRLKSDVSTFIKTCHICQLTGKPNQTVTPAPLQPIPAVRQPFEHLIIDCVGPLPRSKSGCSYLLTVMCQSTRYPAAYPLRTISARSVVKALSQFISVFGVPKIIQSDQGSNFTSRLFEQVLKQLQVRHQKSSVYHPQSQGALERFHQHLKSLIRAYCTELKADWEEGLPWLLLAAREVVQESTGFSPNDLVFGHTVRGPLAIVQDKWMSPKPDQNLLDYVNGFKQRLYAAGELAKENLGRAQKKNKRLYDRKVERRTYDPGDQVLVLLPMVESPFQAKFFGPCTVLRQVSELNHLISMPNKRKTTKVCHVNLLKPYHARVSDSTEQVAGCNGNPILLAGVTSSPSLEVAALEEEESLLDSGVLQPRLKNSEALSNICALLGHLDECQCEQLVDIIHSYSSLFSDTPSCTGLIEHDIDIGDSPPIKQRFYRMTPEKREILESEVTYMLTNGLAEPSSSAWASPCLLVKKPDASFRPCTDFRKVNAITKPDSYPLPRMEDCVDQVGAAKYVSKFDLLKGYWQVPLSKRAREICSFVTPSGLYSYTVMPFGLRNAPATFQRLMNEVVSGLQGCAVYLDDVVVYSETWEEHLCRIKALFDRLVWANLTVNLAKCEFARATVTYLGKIVGQGEVQPVHAKVTAIKVYPTPSTKKELMRFLGMAGYYRSFCANFSSVVAPLTNLLKADAKFIWSHECQKAFEKVKELLASEPVLAAPRLGEPFQLQVDASNVGAGAVLMQPGVDGVARPVGFFSKKFKSYQLHYSVTEKEALALVWAPQHFDVYVGSGGPLVVYTDHNPLTFLKSLQNPNQRLMRWALFLQPYELDIRHIKGTANSVADALSHAFAP